MVTPRCVLSKQVHNATQKFDGLLTKPQLGNLREMTLGMVLGESSYLSTIGSVMAGEVTPRKNTERYSRALEGMDAEECMKRHIACAATEFRSEVTLALVDGGDFQKPHARKMKKVCKTVDGSEGHSVGRGYPTFGCVAYGTESGQHLPMFHHAYSAVDEEFTSAWAEEKKCLGWLSPLLFGRTKDCIIVNDRGGDDERRFLYCVQELKTSFLTRIDAGKSSRSLCIMRDGDARTTACVASLIPSAAKRTRAAKTWRNTKIGKTLTSRITWEEVRLPCHPEIPLFLVFLFTEGFPEPIVLLTDIRIGSAKKAWEIFFFYKKRWEVENFFRAIKQEFRAEKFLIRSFNAIRSLAMVQMLAFCLLKRIREEGEELFGLLFRWFQEFCRKWQRAKQSPLDLLQWIREIARHPGNATSSYRHFSLRLHHCLCPKPRNQLALFSGREKW